ncbi:hypothetical protein DIPPA_24314 [Diplonema papillatum]|nr:hypothetical protein DIPPA_24314 [Diplonema papillatum]
MLPKLTLHQVLDTTAKVLKDDTMNPCCGSMQTGKLHDQVQRLLVGHDLDAWLRDHKLSWNKFLKLHEDRFKFVARSKDEILTYGLSTSTDDPRLAVIEQEDENILQADIMFARWREYIQQQVFDLILTLPASHMSLERVLSTCQDRISRFTSFIPSKNSLKDLVSNRYRVKYGELVPRFDSYQHQPYSSESVSSPTDRKSPGSAPSDLSSSFSLNSPFRP